MKKFLVASLFIVASAAYVLVSRAQQGATPSFAADTNAATTQAPAQPLVVNSVATNQPTTPPVSKTATKTTTPAPAPRKPTGQYTDGTYVGSVADAYYGNIQVEAIISAGRLANVKILQYPNDQGTSIEINRQALPMLISEAISAQSARVDGISGASETSPAFVESLSSALAQAKA